MAFCTECGTSLPDAAAFCTNCGAPVRAAENESADVSYASGQTGADAQSASDQQYSWYGYPHGPMSKAPLKHSGGGKVAAIVVSIVVILFAAAGYLLDKAVSQSNFTGYWESCAVEVNGQEKDSYFGKDINGLFGIEIREDGTASMCSAFTGKVFSGKWKRDGDAIAINGADESYELTKKNDRVYLFNNGLYIIYKQVDSDIDHPSVPHGSLSKSGNSGGVLPSPGANGASGNTVDGSRFSVQITGAAAYKNKDGKDAMHVYFTYTNHDQTARDAWDTLDFYAVQDGGELQGESEQEDTATGELLSARVRPEVTIQCCYSFGYNANGGEVSFSAFGWDKGKDGGVSAKFTPGKLPGAPAVMVIKAVPEPKWTTSLPGEGILADNYGVAVRGAELTTDENGGAAVRIYYNFTNGGNKKAGLEDVLGAYTYQDGVSLEPVEASSPTDMDKVFSKSVASGETVRSSRVYRLRNNSSQIEAEIESQDSYEAIGQTYSVKS